MAESKKKAFNKKYYPAFFLSPNVGTRRTSFNFIIEGGKKFCLRKFGEGVLNFPSKIPTSMR